MVGDDETGRMNGGPGIPRRDVPRLVVLCFGVWLHAANSMLAATTLPAAAREFGGAELIGWAFALYLLGSILAGAGAGMLARAQPIRRGLVIAAGLYLIGCVICAMAPVMHVVLAGRLVQGLGGGLLVALTYIATVRWFAPRLIPRLMALVSGVWSVSAFCGPLVGGGFSTYGDWRWAFWAFVLQAGMMILAVRVLIPVSKTARQTDTEASAVLRQPAAGLQSPGPPPLIRQREYPPILRLVLLSGAIIAVAGAGAYIDPFVSPALCMVGAGLLWLVLRLDRTRRETRMFPSAPLSLRRPVGTGLCFVLGAAFSSMSFLVYGPYLLENLHGLTPLAAGFVVMLESIGWGLAAIAVSRLGETAEPRLIRAGAVLIVGGLTGFALALPTGPIWAVIVCALASGMGFGVCWASVVRRITSHAAPEQKDVAAAAIHTMQQIGYAFGAGTVGIVANVAGLSAGAGDAALDRAALWIFAAFIPFALFAGFAAFRLARAADPETGPTQVRADSVDRDFS